MGGVKMKKLPVKVDELAFSMSFNSYDSTDYLDTETGELVNIPVELENFDFDDELEVKRLPDWMKEILPAAREIAEETGRYYAVPKIPSYEIYNLMEEFAETMSDVKLRNKLLRALNGRGAFGRFKDVLCDYPKEQDRWFRMEEEYLEQQAREWLEELEIEPE